MCTVTAYTSSDSLIVTMNRDERVDRHEAGWRIDTQPSTNYLYPIDGATSGTWFGVLSSGIILCLLNRYQDHKAEKKTSRGQIITQALELGKYHRIVDWLENKFVKEIFNPFRLLIFKQQCIDIYDWNNSTLTHQQLLDQPWFIATSSSKNADYIIPYRNRLFTDWLKTNPTPKNIMDFHLKQDQNAKSESILMSRSYSHTKSIIQCIVDNISKRSHISYIDDLLLPSLVNKTQNEALDQSTQFSLKLTH